MQLESHGVTERARRATHAEMLWAEKVAGV